MARSLSTLTQRIRRALSDMNYAQRRMFEIRTGVSGRNSIDSVRDKAMIAELEAHWRM